MHQPKSFEIATGLAAVGAVFAALSALRAGTQRRPRLMRVLYVAFYFPPTSGGGVERTLRFCEHLPEHGIECEVLAPVDARWLADDPASLARVPDGLRVHRVRYPRPRQPRAARRPARGRHRPVQRALVQARLAPQRLLLPDVDVPWLADLLPAATRLLRAAASTRC